MSVKSLRKPLEQFVRFNLVGLVNTGIDFLIFTLLLSLGFFALGAQSISYIVGTLNSYFMNKHLTFKHQKGQRQVGFDLAQFTKFVVINLVVLGCSLPILHLLIQQVGLHPIWAKVIITCFTVCINFFASRRWVFNEKNDKHHEHVKEM